MRGRAVAALIITVLLMGTAQILAQNASTSDASTDGPQGAADDSGFFHPAWIALIGIGFVVFVMAGLLWRRHQRPGAR